MRSDTEFQAWIEAMRPHRGGEGVPRVLELGAGTGQMTAVLLALGCQVTAVDLCQAMIDKAAAKHRTAGARVSFHLGDAENTMMPDEGFDLVVSRHLVWTLLDPEAALADWCRALKPGGRVVIVDGDWVNAPKRIRARLARFIFGCVDRLTGGAPRYDAAAHEAIISQFYFKAGLRVERLQAILERTGFTNVAIADLRRVHAARNHDLRFIDRLKHLYWHDHYFAISAIKI